jgi:hypothetical protein
MCDQIIWIVVFLKQGQTPPEYAFYPTKERRFNNCPICGLAFLYLRSQKIFCTALGTRIE